MRGIAAFVGCAGRIRQLYARDDRSRLILDREPSFVPYRYAERSREFAPVDQPRTLTPSVQLTDPAGTPTKAAHTTHFSISDSPAPGRGDLS